ncbi:MAG: hypothetical protein H6672_03495 [Anaerolineaceae bacterium]|nr:hypothetical protein [Anaerolineaceae bacterium]
MTIAQSDVTPIPDSASIALLNENLAQGRLVQALYQVEARAALYGWSPDLLVTAGNIWYANGDPWQAVDYWFASVQAAPERADLVRRLAETLLEIQRWPEAVDALNRLVTLTPNDRWGHYQLGLLLAAANPPAAREHLEQASIEGAYQELALALLAVLSSTADAGGAMRVGVVLAEHELWSYAEIAFNFAASARESFPEALAYTGLARDKQGKDGGEPVAAALRLAPEDPQILYLYGLHLRVTGDLIGSRDMLLRAAILEPENPAFAAETGTAYRLTGDLEQAEAWLKIAVQLSGDDPAFERLLALFYTEEGFNLSNERLTELQNIVGRLPDDPDTIAAYGWALHLLADDALALEQFGAALALDPQNPRALFYKALVWIGGNDETLRADATHILEQVAAGDSEFAPEAQRVLDSLASGG